MLQSEFLKDQMILFSEWPKANILNRDLLLAFWWQPAFRSFPWVSSITEHYELVLDRNNQYDLEGRM